MTDSVSEEGSLVQEIDCALAKLFSINRSLTGEGNRQTFDILGEIIPLKTIEYPSGGKVYDWTVPDEWLIRDAYIAKPWQRSRAERRERGVEPLIDDAINGVRVDAEVPEERFDLG